MRQRTAAFFLTGAFLAAAAVSTGAFGSGERAYGAEQVQVINNTTPSNPGPGATLERFPAEESAAEDRYVDEQPVRWNGTIASVDAENGYILLNGQEGQDQLSQLRVSVGQGVPVIDAVTGMPVQLSELQEGEPVYAWISQMMTMSIPAQSPLQAMVVNLPEDAAAPQYVVIKSVEADGNGNYTFTDQEGARWTAREDSTSVTPYLTRQMILLQGIEEGMKCMIWPGQVMGTSMPPVYSAEKIMVFNF